MAYDERSKAIGFWNPSATIGVRSGRVLVAAVSLLSLEASPAHAASTTTYTYDALGRLIQASTIGTVNNGSQVSMVYDATDNRINYQVTGPNNKVVVVPINGLTVVPVLDN